VYPTLEALGAAAVASANREHGTEDGVLRQTYAKGYANSDGTLGLIVLRIEGGPEGGRWKSFRQARACPGGFKMKAPPTPWPIFNRAGIANAAEIIIVEGEKAAIALIKLGFPATTSPGGAGKAHLADWAPLAGKRCVLWPDCDPPDPKTGKRTGFEHMKQVAERLQALEPMPAVFWIDPDGLTLPPKGDAADFVARLTADGMTDGEVVYVLEGVLDDAKSMDMQAGPVAELATVLDDAMCGRRCAIALPWPKMSEDSRALLPGTLTLICGSPDASKSFALLQALRHWVTHDISAAVLMLEDGATYHLRRCLAQMANEARLTDDDFCRDNPAAVKAAQAKHQEMLVRLARCIDAPKLGERATADSFLAWLRRRAQAGARVLAIDPATGMQRGPSPWADDEKLVWGAKAVAEEFKLSILLVTHPRKQPSGFTQKNMTKDDLAGGACYARFSQCILCLAAHDLEVAKIPYSMGIGDGDTNRTWACFKSRNGTANGNRYAAFFDPKTLTLTELGRRVD
jgi:hypothetical protein